jgi:hypothetical protein
MLVRAPMKFAKLRSLAGCSLSLSNLVDLALQEISLDIGTVYPPWLNRSCSPSRNDM